MRLIPLLPFVLILSIFASCNAESGHTTSEEIKDELCVGLVPSVMQPPVPRDVVDELLQGIGTAVVDASKKVEAFVNDVVKVQLSKASVTIGTNVQVAVRQLIDDITSGKVKGPAVDVIRPIIAAANATIFVAQRVERVIDDMTKGKGVSSERVSEEIGTLFRVAVIDVALVPRTQTFSHSEREGITANVLERVGLGLVDASRALGVPEQNAQELGTTFGDLAPLVGKIVVAVGDIAEQHPTELRVIIWIVTLLIPGNVPILRLLLNLFFGLITAQPGSFTSLGTRVVWDTISPVKGEIMDLGLETNILDPTLAGSDAPLFQEGRYASPIYV